MKIAILVEGMTEKAFMPPLRSFLRPRLQEMPSLRPIVYDGRIPKEDKLKRVVEILLGEYDAVIALTDVYTGTRDFVDASDAKAKWSDGLAITQDSIRMPPSTISRHGCYRFGQLFND